MIKIDIYPSIEKGKKPIKKPHETRSFQRQIQKRVTRRRMEEIQQKAASITRFEFRKRLTSLNGDTRQEPSSMEEVDCQVAPAHSSDYPVSYCNCC